MNLFKSKSLKTPNVAIKVVEKYSSKTTLRALVNLIPYVGGSIDILLTSRSEKISSARLEKYLQKLKHEFKAIDESKIDYTFLNSEEFYDLVLQTFNSVLKSRSEDKISLYSKILKDSVIGKFKDPLVAEDLINSINDLSLNDIELIKIISKYISHPNVPKRHKYYRISTEDIINLFPEYKEEQLWAGLLRLEKNNVIVRNNTISSTILEHTVYSETPFLLSIIDYLIEKI